MENEIYARVRREFEEKRDEKIRKAKQKKEEFLSNNKDLQEIQDEINRLALKTTTTILTTADNIKRQVEQENFEMKIKKLEEKYERLVVSKGYKLSDFEPEYDCKKCNDSGLVKEKDGTNKYCHCFLQKVIDETYNESNMLKIKEENFESFDIGFYSKKVDKEKYGLEKSPLENIETIRKIAIEFCDNIESQKQKNLLFTGNTGLGKTFLANCIASKLIKSGKSVVYQTAPILMDKIIEYKFSQFKDSKSTSEYKRIFDVDLLIIDDLGTESMNNLKFTELFNVINTRILNNKKILISTNLTLNELYKEYDERVMSRLIGNFIICKFIGDDIRLKKKRLN